jgi:sulfate transport system ATP-binding protein
MFRGNQLEVHLRVRGRRVVAYRSLENEAVTIGERVSVLIYRLYLLGESSVKLVENNLLIDKAPVFI